MNLIKLKYNLIACFLILSGIWQVLLAQATWNGSVSTDWNTAANWTWASGSGIPTATTNVTIPNANFARNYPILVNDVTINSLTFNNAFGTNSTVGARIDLNGFTLTVDGDFVVQAHNRPVTREIGNAATGGKLIVSGGRVDMRRGMATVNVNVECDMRINIGTSTIRQIIFHQLATLRKTDGSVTSCGGNRFEANAVFEHTGTGTWQWGNNASGGEDVFTQNLTTSSTAGNIILGNNTTNNQFNTANMTISNTGRTQINEATFGGAVIFEANNVTGSLGFLVAHNTGNEVTFDGVTTIRNINSNVDWLFRCSRQGITNFNNNVLVESNGGTTGTRTISIGNDLGDVGTVNLAASRTIRVGAGGYTSGTLQINKLTQDIAGANTHTHLLNVTVLANIVMNRNILSGNLTMSGEQTLQIRTTVFGGIATNAINITNNCINEALVVNCGGNRFRGIARISNNGRSKWYWGEATAGPDVFETTAFFVSEDNLTPLTPITRPTAYRTNYPTTYSTAFTSFAVPVDFIVPPYYVPRSGTWTGSKQGFPDYPRVDNLPTNTGDPAQDALNAIANENAGVANLADQETSEQNQVNATISAVNTANQMDANRGNLEAAVANADIVLPIILTTPAYLNNEGAMVALYNALQTIRDAGNSFFPTFDAALAALNTAAADANNTPTDDLTAANAGIAAMNQANLYANQIHQAINALHTQLNTLNVAFNATLAAAIAASNNTGVLAVAYNTTGNLFQGATTFDARVKGRLWLAYTTNATATFEQTATIINTSQGSNFEAYYINSFGTNPQITFKGNVTITQNGLGNILMARNGPCVFEQNLLVNHIQAGLTNIGFDNQPGTVTLMGDPTFNLQRGTLELGNFTKVNTNPLTVTTLNTAAFNVNGISNFNGNTILNNRATAAMQIANSQFANVTFNGSLTLINQNNQRIELSNNGQTRINGNLEVSNLANLPAFNSRAVAFGSTGNGKTYLSSGFTIQVTAFSRGQLYLGGFIQEGATNQLIDMSAYHPDASLYVEKQTTFNGITQLIANRMRFLNSIFNEDATITCIRLAANSGGNLFNKKLTLEFRGTGNWIWGDLNKDTFMGEVVFYNNGTNSRMNIAHNSVDNLFNNQVTLRNGGATGCLFYVARQTGSSAVFKNQVIIENNASAGSIIVGEKGNVTFEGNVILQPRVNSTYFFGGNSTDPTHTGTVTIASTGGMSIDATTPWISGRLHLKNFVYNPTNPLTLHLTNGTNDTRMFVGPGSSFAGDVDFKSQRMFLNGAVYNGKADIERTAGGGVDDQSLGDNVFNGITKFTNSSNRITYLGAKKGDEFNADVVFSIPNNGRIIPAYAGLNYFAGNITVIGGTGARFDFGGTGTPAPALGVGTGSVIMDGTGTQSISNQLANTTRLITFRELNVRQGDATSIVSFDRDFTITNYLLMTRGKIRLNNGNINILNSTDASSVSVLNPLESYIIANQSGVVNRQVPNTTTNVLFPVGNEVTYTPATISQDAAGVTDNYRVRVLDNVFLSYANAAGDYAPTGAQINSYFTRRTWVITEQVAGGSNCDLTLQWNSTAPSDELPNFDRNTVSVVRFNNGTNRWACTQPYGPALGPPNTRRTTTGVRNMGVFSIATVKAIAGPDQTICSPGDINLSATALDSPFDGVWSKVSGPNGVTIVDPNDPVSLVTGLTASSVYVFRWRNLSLEGDCGSDIFDDVQITVGNNGVVSGVTSVTWTGASDNDWFNCANWTDFTIPTQNIDVIIPNTTALPNAPLISSTGPRARNITIQANGVLNINHAGSLIVEQNATIQANGTLVNDNILHVKGNLTNQGTLTYSNLVQVLGNFSNQQVFNATNANSTLELSGNFTNDFALNHTLGLFRFQGNLNTLVNGSVSPTLHNLEMAKTAGNRITLSQPVRINGVLTLVSGLIYTSNAGLLIIQDNALATAGNAVSYVNGPLRKIGDDGFTFPVGKNGRWARIAISSLNNTNPNDYFTAEYFPQKQTFGQNIIGMNNISTVEYWILDRGNTGGGAGTTEARVRLHWEDAVFSGIDLLGVNDLVVAHFNGVAWEPKGGSEAGSLPSGSVLATIANTSFSPFTFGSLTDIGNPLPVSLLSFTAQLTDNEEVELEWKTGFELNIKAFEVEKSNNGIDYAFLARLESRGNTSGENNHIYRLLDREPHDGINYYRLKVVNIDDSKQDLKIISITLTDGKAQIDNIYPNPFAERINLKFSLPQGDKYQIMVKDKLGRSVLNQSGVSEGANWLELNLQGLPTSEYFLEIISSKGKLLQKIVKIH
ncbi:MAG: T9SS type A sorting domain-containing protein [Microscillaceae bacterium]|jgi:hypothetical protein|nr:T9SS type A sorting domain-containing protein [Microscillaceae bacterium]